MHTYLLLHVYKLYRMRLLLSVFCAALISYDPLLLPIMIPEGYAYASTTSKSSSRYREPVG